jgi:hypothetical protein
LASKMVLCFLGYCFYRGSGRPTCGGCLFFLGIAYFGVFLRAWGQVVVSCTYPVGLTAFFDVLVSPLRVILLGRCWSELSISASLHGSGFRWEQVCWDCG